MKREAGDYDRSLARSNPSFLTAYNEGEGPRLDLGGLLLSRADVGRCHEAVRPYAQLHPQALSARILGRLEEGDRLSRHHVLYHVP